MYNIHLTWKSYFFDYQKKYEFNFFTCLMCELCENMFKVNNELFGNIDLDQEYIAEFSRIINSTNQEDIINQETSKKSPKEMENSYIMVADLQSPYNTKFKKHSKPTKLHQKPTRLHYKITKSNIKLIDSGKSKKYKASLNYIYHRKIKNISFKLHTLFLNRKHIKWKQYCSWNHSKWKQRNDTKNIKKENLITPLPLEN